MGRVWAWQVCAERSAWKTRRSMQIDRLVRNTTSGKKRPVSRKDVCVCD